MSAPSQSQTMDSSPPGMPIKESDSPGGDDAKSNGGSGSNPGDKPQKLHRPLNRVPRACNACRKQKMKCTDADNPPCKRCRNAGIECVFEKPIRDTVNNSEQGLRIRNLETQVTSIQSTLAELVHTLRAAVPQASVPSPSSHASSSNSHHAFPPPQPQHPSPANYGAPSPSLSANSGGGAPSYLNGPTAELPPTSNGHLSSHGPNAPPLRQYRSTSTSSGRTIGYQSSPGSHPPQVSPPMSGPPLHHPGPESHYRSNADSQYAERRSGQSQMDHYPPPHHPPHGSQQHPPMMPPPTSLPPFSAIDAHSTGHRPQLPGLHIPSGNRQPFAPALSPRKGVMTSPISMNNGGYGAGGLTSQNYSPQLAHPIYSPVNHYHDSAHGHEAGAISKHASTDPLSSSNVTSADSSDDEGELPAHGMVAPFTAIRGLADAAERAVEENGGESDPPTRAGSPSRTDNYDSPHNHHQRGLPSHYEDDRNDGRSGKRSSGKSGGSADRPSKRRRIREALPDDPAETPIRALPDVVTKGILSEEEGRELFNIFFTGCSMFLPVFDVDTDTYDALHKRSPFCVNAICMVAAKVRDGGGPPSETYKKCLKEVHDITCATLFAPVMRQEVVQAMILVAGWGAGPKDSGWLTCGHATRMALELGMHKAWPKLLKRMHAGKAGTSLDEKELVISARTWFCLYLFEHQMSFGTGRPAVLKEDESVHECRLLLTHPLAIQDDMRLVSMVELMIIRERTQNLISPADNAPVDDSTFRVLQQSRINFEGWLHIWSNNFSKRYEAAAFHRQSLEAQVAFAELYHNAIALRTIRGPEDVAKIQEEQRELALRSIKVAQNALHVCLRSPSYREGMKYAVQYTHLSATFTASFLMRLARLFPDDCDLPTILADVEQLVEILSEIPATRFARTLKLMLRATRRRRTQSTGRSSDGPSPSAIAIMPGRPIPMANPPANSHPSLMGMQQMGGQVIPNQPIPPGSISTELDQFMFDSLSGTDVSLWLSESSLRDFALSQQGLDAFGAPPSLEEQRMAPEIW